MSVRAVLCRLLITGVLPSAAVFATAAAARPAPAAPDLFASNWSRSVKSAARLIAVGGGWDGTYRAGMEIRLEANTITYWRTPGEAGAPPVLTDTGSTNVANLRMDYPAPRLFDTAGAKAFGYDKHVIFPIHITAKDPTQPVTLRVKLDYEACEKICIPAKAEAQLSIPLQREFGPYEDSIATYEARVPMQQKPGADAPLTITAVRNFEKDPKTGKGSFSVVGRVPANTPPPQFFAEGPTGWYLEPGPITPAPDGTFTTSVAVTDMPKDADAAKTPFVFTLVAGGRAIEVTAHLDEPAKAL
jgi:DsbC/DsbD-like thiol-disulfide interchange protein